MTGPGWTSDPVDEVPVAPDGGWTGTAVVGDSVAPGPGWFALMEKVADLVGEGALSCAVRPRQFRTVYFDGGGVLGPVVASRHYREMPLSGDGAALVGAYRIVDVAAEFGGEGRLEVEPFEGLSAHVFPRYLVAVEFSGAGDGPAVVGVVYTMNTPLSGGGVLVVDVRGIHYVIGEFDGMGTLTAEVTKLAGNSAAELSGVGALSVSAAERYDGGGASGGVGTMAAAAFERYVTVAATVADGTLSAAAFARFASAAGLSGGGALAGAGFARYGRDSALGGGGTIAATAEAVPSFTPFNEENVTRTNEPIPVGCAGVWVTATGGGGGGGGGDRASTNNNGGGGGGGGGRVYRVFCPVASLGPTYSTTIGAAGVRGSGAGISPTVGTAGGASIFTSGSVSLSAGGGGGGGSNNSTPGGAGGTCSVSGVSATTANGTAGGAGSAGGLGSDAADNTSGGAGGGGGGGGGKDTGAVTTANGGAGGDSVAAAGGAGGNPNGVAGGPGTVSNPVGSGGGGGRGFTTGYSAGVGGYPGGGGGGGGGRRNSSGDGGDGGNGGSGRILLEWV